MILIPQPCPSPEAESSLFAGTTLSDWVAASSTYAMFRSSALQYGATTAITHLETGDASEVPSALSYSQLYAEITRTANLLSLSGASHENSVALLLPNLIETHLCLWGAGAVSSALPLNHMLSVKVLVELMRLTKARVLVAAGPDLDAGIWQKAMEVRAALGNQLRWVVQVGGTPIDDPDVVYFSQIKDDMPADRLIADEEPGLDDIAAYFHTGGTTGSPKLVKHTHRNHLAAAFAFASRHGLSQAEVFVNGLPLYHVGGVLPCSLAPFMAGAHLLNLSPTGMRNQRIQANIWRIVERYGVTSLNGVPTALGAMSEVPIDGAQIASIRKVWAGAALLPSNVAHRVESLLGVPVREVYGMTETSGVICSEFAACRPVTGSAGFAVPFMEVQVRPICADGSLSESSVIDQPGALVVRGATVTPGYMDPAQNIDAFTHDGWLMTGDVAIQHTDGRVTLTGRSKDLIIRSGHNIDPLMIEEAAMSYPGVAVAAAVGQPDAYAGELPVCYVVAKGAQSLDLDALQEYLAEVVPERPAVPKRVYQVDSLPLTSVGKVFKPALRSDAAKRMVMHLLSDFVHPEIEVDEDGKRGLHVTVSLTDDLASSAIREAIEDRLRPFLFRWSIQSVGEEQA
ncbi:AMP-binding protein [Pseudomonas aeruginosa]|uniref:AMP-binding protein n=1 Tax=Pseudomonas aeruginosa TaxID=287 RepID=UPI000EB5D72E|nr:AMP-binding protein [Pseudomonas aeruginosa]EIU1413944.1 AMP-binding protein [Pseudomonas aeruginosa]MCG9956504.1 AMP-binding protein [Pseudomonas aeruginosa]RPW10789.1 acyl-CoA synthetase [Pseudomonas aeruginosa]RTB51803.1 acyl-CoA synthetase [Pseudomonas aeruginosa]RTC34181.1 acyl-CoA synthetase [Pseudomonas aeruginosa]